MEAQIEQPRLARTRLRQQGRQRVGGIVDHLLRAHEAVGVEELHVVAVERIGHDQQASVGVPIPIGQIVIEAVRGVCEAALRQQAARPDALAAATEEPHGADPGGGGDRLDAAVEIGRLARPVRVVGMRPPAPAMDRHLVAVARDRGGERGQTGHGLPTGEEGRGHPMMLQRIEHPPQTGAHAIGEDLLLADVARARGHDADHLADAFALEIAVPDLTLRAFLEIDDNGNREPAAIGPGQVGPDAPISKQIALHLVPLPLWRHSPSSLARRRRRPA